MHYSPGTSQQNGQSLQWGCPVILVLVIASQYLSVEQEVTGRVQRILISYYALHNKIMAILIAHAQLGVVMTCNRCVNEIELHSLASQLLSDRISFMVVWEDRGVLKPPKPPIVHATDHYHIAGSYTAIRAGHAGSLI